MTTVTSYQDQKDADENSGLSMKDIVRPIWQKRKSIILVSLATGLVAYLVNFFLLPVYYKSSATLLPETEKSKLAALGGFADVAQKLLGDNIPGSEIARLYPTVVSSETILRSVIQRKYATKAFRDSVDLLTYFELTDEDPDANMYDALKHLRSLLTATTEPKTGIVTVTLEMEEQKLAADVLNTIVSELDNFMRLKKLTTATEQVKWIDVRLKEVQVELKNAEETLKNFREKNRRIADSPDLILQQDRLVRDVSVKSTIFIELKKQFELAKLEEIKNITIVNVLDPGRPPVKKERPKRIMNSLLFMMASLIVCAGYFVIKANYSAAIVAGFNEIRS
jgi:tyrosine-protein kinase Etk/Wzc